MKPLRRCVSVLLCALATCLMTAQAQAQPQSSAAAAAELQAQAQAAEQERIAQEQREAAEAERRQAELAEMNPAERLVAEWLEQLAAFAYDPRNQQAHTEFYQNLLAALNQATETLDMAEQKTIAEKLSFNTMKKHQPSLFSSSREKEPR